MTRELLQLRQALDLPIGETFDIGLPAKPFEAMKAELSGLLAPNPDGSLSGLGITFRRKAV